MKLQFRAEVLPILFILAAAFIVLYAVAALADTLSFTWDDPIAREDGTPLTLAEIDRVEIHISQSDADLNPPHTVVMAGGCTDTVFNLILCAC